MYKKLEQSPKGSPGARFSANYDLLSMSFGMARREIFRFLVLSYGSVYSILER